MYIKVPTSSLSWYVVWSPCSVALSIEEAAKPLIFEGVQTGSMPNCVAGVARRDILARQQMVSKDYCVTGPIVWRCSLKMTFIFRGRRDILENSIVITGGRAVFAGPLCVESDFAWQAQYFGHSTLYTLHSTLYTLHFTLHTIHYCTPHHST